ncbi:MAG: MC/SLC25 family protein [Legionella sp.]|nr:MC/SLC25 family protein [Legionella sp.]
MTKAKHERAPNHKATVFESIIIGSVATATEVMIDHPLWTLKTRAQYGSGFTINPQILYRGVVPNMISMAPITSIQMGVDRGIQNVFFDGVTKPSNYQQVASAFVAGVASATVSCPIEMIMTQQSKLAGGFFTVGSHLIKQSGWRCLSTGFFNIAMREGIFTVGYAVTSPYLKSKIKPYCRNDFEASVVSGIGAGVPAASASQANDTLKTIQQAADPLQPVRAIDAAKKIYSTHGVCGFFKGGFWRGARVASAITIIGTVKGQMEEQFFNQGVDTSFKK